MKCTESEKKSQLRHYYSRKSLYVEKLGGVCTNCGASEDLEFDHIDPDSKSFTIGNKVRLDLDTVLEELKKCQLLCNDCHLKKSKAEGSLSKGWTNKARLVHGSKWTYQHHGCRCEICREANRERNRLRRKGFERKFRDIGPMQHGQRRFYLKGCRCSLCKEANAAYSRGRRT